jgi:predicted nucleotidyltransferase
MKDDKVMIKKKYLKQISAKVGEFKKKNKGAKIFIFGSALRRKKFGDVDLGVAGKVSRRDIAELKEDFVDSVIPYFIDIINFNGVSEKFKANVFNNKVLWIKR